MTEETERDIVSEAETVPQVINALHRRARQRAESAVDDAVKIGDILKDVKSNLKHGEWQSWIDENCEFSLRTAQLYMKASTAKTQQLRFSSLRQLYSPEGEADTEESSPDDSMRDRRPTPTQLEADVMEINNALEKFSVPMRSADDFVDEAGATILTEKARKRLDWLVALHDALVNVESLP